MYVIQRADCTAFAPCHAKDAEYGLLVCEAQAAGVQLVALQCECDPESGTINMLQEVPVHCDYGKGAGQAS